MTEPLPADLESSVAEGIITQAQAEAIQTRRAGQAANNEPANQEPFKLVNSFGDIFLCIGLVILFFSFRAFGAIVFVEPLMVLGGFALLYWLLAEYFTFRARRRFPAVVSSLLFIWLAYQAGITLFGHIADPLDNFELPAAQTLSMATLASAAAMIRFRLPILVLLTALCATALAFALVRSIWAEAPALWVLGVCGLVLLGIGISLDRRDPQRNGPQHEWALWLFVTGSPLTIHPLFISLLSDRFDQLQQGVYEGMFPSLGPVVWVIAALALGFIMLGLLLDRRSLVASTLVYVTGVLTYITTQGGIGLALAAAVVPLGIGLGVIVLGVAWVPMRRSLLQVVPAKGLFRPAD